MDPSIDNEWLGIKQDQIEENQVVGNIVRSWQWRETGINPPNHPPNKLVLENLAEDILVQKSLKIRSCDLPGYPRSTFLMVFSPDGTKVASTHGNHNVYVSELASGKHVRILKGHPRTPWCIAFHPSHTQLIGSGCLGGQVRVWDIASGGSEVWNVRNETVIASIAFHPREQLLVIATYNELYFWDWSQPAPFTKVSTNNVNEKVRYVAFDALGYKLITGISLRGTFGSVVANNALLAQSMFGNSPSTNRREDADNPSGNQSGENPGSAQDMIVNSYQNLVQRYDSLVRNYQRLFMVRNRLNNPPVPTTMDRGTDPMETDLSSDTSTWTRIGSSRPRQNNTNGESSQGASNSENNGEGEAGTRILNLDVLSLENERSRNQDSTTTEPPSFGSRSSAFQPLSEYGRPFSSAEQNDGATRLLPNPFSSSNSSPRVSRISLAGIAQRAGIDNTNTSRTSIFTSARSGSISRRVFVFRRRNFSPTRRDLDSSRGESSTSTESATQPSPPRRTLHHNYPEAELHYPNERRRPTMANSSTQMSPTTTPLDAQTLNESLDLIRDILRDSGTRLLNLITDMSLSVLADTVGGEGGEGGGGGGGDSSRAHSDEGARSQRASRPRARLLSSTWRREFLSSSESDSDNTLEVNILRTRNSTFREDNSESIERPSTSEQANARAFSTDRMVFELSGDPQLEGTSRDPNGVNVSLSSERFRVRTQSGSGAEPAAAAATDEAGPSQRRMPSTSDFSRPSTSRDTFWPRGGGSIPSDEAYRKVRSGISALHKHTVQLVNLSQRRNRTTTRELRVMWENLRRRILTLHRETGRPDVPGYYTRSLLERCMMLAEMHPSVRNTNRNTLQRDVGGNREEERNLDPPTSGNINLPEANGRRDHPTAIGTRRQRRSDATHSRSLPNHPTASSTRRRVQSTSRWRHDDELRRRSRNPVTNRLAQRYSNRSRRDFTRAIEINATRHEIRMRAMQVLSVMFNMMMMCLEERGLSQLIIIMLRTLKKAMALTCYMLMANRNNGRSGLNTASTSQPLESVDVVRIQNVDDAGPVNVDGLDEAMLSTNTRNEEAKQEKNQNKNERAEIEKRSFSQGGSTSGNACEVLDLSASSSSFPSQRWSNRLAVQIAAANKNNSATARNRRELYLESRRLKALHRTNPSAHPLIKKRVMPPLSTYRIPHLRNFPNRPISTRFMLTRREHQNNDPVAGPSNAPPSTENTNQEPRGDGMLELDERVNFIRITSQTIRNAPRNRFRRLQTIRLYTPSSVREMFALQPNSTDNLQENRSPLQSNPETGTRRPFTVYRPHILTPRSESANRPDAQPQVAGFFNTLTGAPVPGDMPIGLDMPGITFQRIPRIHDYLQPIILAQNAMIVEDEGAGNNNPGGIAGGDGDGGGGSGGGGGGGGDGGSGSGGGPAGGASGAGGLGSSLSGLMGGGRRLSGMAGLLDAGIISEALPAPSHRVQAWDFTTGAAPDIADTTKNVVVQRCRIHNDASIDISRDGRLLVALLPVPRLRNTNHWLGVYSLEWSRLGQCLHTAVMEQAAVSVALSPTARHLAVGLGSRRFTSAPHARNNVFALLYRLDPHDRSSRTGLSPVKELEQNWEHGFTSLNCLRWAPQPGQGLVYANNTGQLIIMS